MTKSKNSFHLLSGYMKISIFCGFLGYIMIMAPGRSQGNCINLGTCTRSSTISLQITNSFTANTTLLSTGYTTGGITYVGDEHLLVQMHASTGSNFVLSGTDIAGTFIGNGIGNYTIDKYITITNTNGIKNIPSIYIKGNEPLTVTPLSVFLDTTKPSQPDPIGPGLGTWQEEENILFSRNASIDTGSGFQGYTIFISTDPGFSSPISFSTNQPFISIPQNILPSGILYRQVQAIDNVGNINNGLPAFFINDYGNRNTNHTGGGGNINTPTVNKKENTKINPEKNNKQEHNLSPKKYDTQNNKKNKDIQKEVRRKNILMYIYNRNHKTIQQNTEHYSATDKAQKNAVQNNIYDQLTLPGYLAKTGASPQMIQKYLGLLSERAIDDEIKKQLHKILHFIKPGRPAGVILFITILCYDIETYKKWQKIHIK